MGYFCFLLLALPGNPKATGSIYLVKYPWTMLRASYSDVGDTMNRLLLISLFASAAAWVLIRTSHSSNRVIPVTEAAAKLQQAWADHHTTA
jgi:hypothetical protein